MSSPDHDLNAAAIALERAKRVVCVSHRKPDGDTLGAMLALADALEHSGKTVHRYCVDPVPPALQFLSGAERVVNSQAIFTSADTVIVFDAGDLRFAMIDGIIASLPVHPTVINIDHHATNERFGDVNAIVTDAASTTEVVYRILHLMGTAVTPSIATNLLVGLMTDTMLFFNPATTAHALQLASALTRSGGDLALVGRALSKNKTVASLVLWGQAFERLKFDSVRSHVSTMLRADELATLPTGDDPIDGLSNFLNSNLNARTVLVLKELTNGMVKGSLRTAREDVDVGAIALGLGGGGHRKAAGYTTKGRIVEKENEWTIETT